MNYVFYNLNIIIFMQEGDDKMDIENITNMLTSALKTEDKNKT